MWVIGDTTSTSSTSPSSTSSSSFTSALPHPYLLSSTFPPTDRYIRYFLYTYRPKDQSTGVDMSKINGGNQNIEGNGVNSWLIHWRFSITLGPMPWLPPKSTPVDYRSKHKMYETKRRTQNLMTLADLKSEVPVWYENLSGVVISPDKSGHEHRWCW